MVHPGEDVEALVRLLIALQSGELSARALLSVGGSCVFCGQDLTKPTSVQQGAGNVCASKYGSPLEGLLLEVRQELTVATMQEQMGGVSSMQVGVCLVSGVLSRVQVPV